MQKTPKEFLPVEDPGPRRQEAYDIRPCLNDLIEHCCGGRQLALTAALCLS
jgi:hypothetical protein